MQILIYDAVQVKKIARPTYNRMSEGALLLGIVPLYSPRSENVLPEPYLEDLVTLTVRYTSIIRLSL